MEQLETTILMVEAVSAGQRRAFRRTVGLPPTTQPVTRMTISEGLA